MRILLLSLLLSTIGNADIVKLVQAGLSPETIEAKIATSETTFDTSTDALVALADEGVPDRIIRAMIESEAMPPVPAVPPVAAVPPAPPAPPRIPMRRYDVTVHSDRGGKCEGELRIDTKGIKASRCRASDFNVTWDDLRSVCTIYGFRGEIVLQTESRDYRLSTTTPAEAKRIVEHLQTGAPSLSIDPCR